MFAALPLDLSLLDDSPIYALLAPQPRIVRVLEEHATELGADIRRGHQLVGLSQADELVSLESRARTGPTSCRPAIWSARTEPTAARASWPASTFPASPATGRPTGRRTPPSRRSGWIPQPVRSTCPATGRSCHSCPTGPSTARSRTRRFPATRPWSAPRAGSVSPNQPTRDEQESLKAPRAYPAA
jgi:hypothetical protein